MDATFEFIPPFPPASPQGFARFHRPGAWITTQTGVALGMKRMDRNIMLLTITLDFFGRPVCQRIQLIQPTSRIPFQYLGVRAGRTLLPANTRNPAIVTRQRIKDGFNFTNPAALMGILTLSLPVLPIIARPSGDEFLASMDIPKVERWGGNCGHPQRIDFLGTRTHRRVRDGLKAGIGLGRIRLG